MAQLIADRRDVDFVLFEQMKVDELAKTELFSDFNKKTIDLIVSSARDLAIKELLPTQAEGDTQGCELVDGKVKVPESFHKAYKLYREGEWIAMADDPEVGGQGMPVTLVQAASEYFVGANCAFIMYPGLTHGAGHIIEVCGSDKQKKLFLKKMFSGQWAGSMCLTEPEAGSDVGSLTTTAKKNPDGTYSITGNKIFISAGDQNLTENIIHPVLARIEGAPAGTKGISLFLVPKIWVNDDGSLGEPNDVQCDRIEEKMGIHGNATCAMTFGAKGKCRGMLIGEENKGMRAMFLMMNEARLGVGVQGFSFGSAAYMYALDYARQRVQGRHLLKFMDQNAPSVAIIEHPDVRRMLMTMKAYVDGMRSFIYYVGKCFDTVRSSKDEAEKATADGMIELLTPVVKSYCTDRAFEVCSMAMQVYGGYGYTKEYPVEQLVRDCRITPIYEGTNGIQAMDLLARKLGMKGGKPFMDLLATINGIVAQAKKIDGLEDAAAKVEAAAAKLGETAMFMGKNAMSDKVLNAFSFANPFLDCTGDLVMAWMLLWRAVIAAPKVAALAGTDVEKIKKNKEAAYYDGLVKTAKFFINTMLPVTVGRMDAIKNMDPGPVAMLDEAFAG